jgi:hypothetical protein
MRVLVRSLNLRPPTDVSGRLDANCDQECDTINIRFLQYANYCTVNLLATISHLDSWAKPVHSSKSTTLPVHATVMITKPLPYDRYAIWMATVTAGYVFFSYQPPALRLPKLTALWLSRPTSI